MPIFAIHAPCVIPARFAVASARRAKAGIHAVNPACVVTGFPLEFTPAKAGAGMTARIAQHPLIMKRICQKYFIPHAGNNYNPHVLHTKRALFYGALFLSMKLILALMVLALPLEVYVLPDVLALEQKRIVEMTNSVRADLGLKKLAVAPTLDKSAQAKANDMATNEYFSHTSPSGKTVRDFMRQAGYRYSVAGENLAMGFTTAEDVVNAWIQSPTHYANLVDTDYADFGIGLESGVYAGEQTVFVAEHFGSPSALSAVTLSVAPLKKAAAVAAKPVQEKPAEVSTAPVETVLAVKELAPVAPAITVPAILEKIFFDRENSKVYWQEENNGTRFSARAKISGPVESAEVLVGNLVIDLKPAGDSLYQGEIFVAQPADNFFRVIVLPNIKIASAGAVIEDNIDWFNIKTVSPTPVEQYVRAQSALSGWTKIFDITRDLYLAFIVFFSLALALSVFIQIKKQHPHIIVQTLGLIGLLACLAIV